MSQRIFAMLLRYIYLHKRSVSRVLEIFFWPVMELFVWGFLTVYLRSQMSGDAGRMIIYLISAMIFWDVLYRAQQGVSISVMEDMWTHNITNIFVSPLRIWEWLAATFIYSLFKTVLITGVLGLLAVLLYQFNLIDALGFYALPLLANLVLFGCALGVFTSGLLLRWGHAVEALIWGIPFLIQPLSAIFYPLSVLPLWLQPIARAIPSTYVFEGMRAVISTQQMPWNDLMAAIIINLIYFIFSGIFFVWMYRLSRASGRLGRLGLD